MLALCSDREYARGGGVIKNAVFLFTQTKCRKGFQLFNFQHRLFFARDLHGVSQLKHLIKDPDGVLGLTSFEFFEAPHDHKIEFIQSVGRIHFLFEYACPFCRKEHSDFQRVDGSLCFLNAVDHRQGFRGRVAG